MTLNLKPLQSHIACRKCGSSDAATLYENLEDNSRFYKCFSCGKAYQQKGATFEAFDDHGNEYNPTFEVSSDIATETPVWKSFDKPYRNIKTETLNKYGVKYNPDDGNVLFPEHTYDGHLVAEKHKKQDGNYGVLHHVPKGFQQAALFGAHLFPPGSSKFITVTEGEFDALSAYEFHGSKFPCVSLKNGVNSVLSENDKKYLDSFETVIYCGDNDAPGLKGAQKFAMSFDKAKVKIVRLSKFKDTNDYAQSIEKLRSEGRIDDATELHKLWLREWWNAKPYSPEGLVQGRDTFDLFINEKESPSIKYPWNGLQELLHGIRTSELIVLTAGSGVGKCFGKNTEVLMYDGTKKKIQDIEISDLVMGPDSTPREVLSTHSGRSQLYKIIPVKGDPIIVNGNHTLCCWDTKYKEYVEIDVKDYLKLTKAHKARLKQYRSDLIDFNKTPELKLDPYWFGLWLGDGRASDQRITSFDKPIIEYIKQYAKTLDLSFKQYAKNVFSITGKKGLANPILDELKALDVIENKHIPFQYLTATVRERFDLLAGILDSDGYLIHNTFEISQKSKTLAYNIVDLANSLGFRTTIRLTDKKDQHNTWGKYYRIFISGNVERIPTTLKRKQATTRKQRKDPKVTGFTIVKYKHGKYYGIEVDKDSQFLLSDYTVVHNSAVLRELSYHIFKTVPEAKIGCMFLEESMKRTVKDFVGIELNTNLRLPENVVSNEVKRNAWNSLFDNDRWIFWDHFGSNDIETVCNQVRFIANNFGAKYIFLDHISILVSDGTSGDERKTLDAIMTRLRMLVQELDICLFCVSHLRRSNDSTPHEEGGVTSLSQLRGSAGIGQLADIVVGLERNGQADSPIERNLTTLRILKNRFTGETGPACHLLWDKGSGRLKEVLQDEIAKLIEEDEKRFNKELPVNEAA